MGIFRIIIALVLTASTRAITIPSTPTWPSGRCTDKSLTRPSWILSQYKVSAGTTTFVVNNQATDPTSLSARVTCSLGKTECQSSAGGNQMRATLTTGPDGRPVISIFELWTCSDEGDRVLFTGNGSTTITSCQGTDCTSPITYLVPGTLVLPVPLTPAQPKPPSGFDAPTCASVGEKQWTISGVEYKNYTRGQCKQWYQTDQICLDNGTGTFVGKGQYLKLNVTNNAIAHEVLCSFTPTYNNINPPNPLRCTGGSFNEITLEVTWTGAAPNFQLKVEELWYCLEKPLTNAKPSVIVATGSTSLPLTCESHTGITGTADDIVTICTDPTPSHAIDGAQTAKESLPPFSLITAYPAHGGCTFDSVVNPTFFYRGMYYETNADQTLSRFTAGLTGPGFADYWFYQNKAISGSGVDTVYTCTVYYDGRPKEQHYKCTYAFNANTKTITQDKIWECRDKNPNAPLYFEGTGEFNWGVDPYSSCSKPGQNQTSCYWHDDLATLQPGIPYDIPKVTVSTVNVLPPDYGQPQVQAVEVAPVKTIRENGEWRLAEGN
ncbi:hypothetical protein K458DRAFT_426178 [Lentithecium fluviatile CBS 122367]|uniref:Ig-like domain-containing protein n=1 Tax=Lentithecium fluviatile CBS 122367 TaxID=1168545 RepID=A0A6G1JJY0_9PLEO|nr:hypothetical protein K458DRAFT_426178 [Lentithecium fluviatile CBS 122367]